MKATNEEMNELAIVRTLDDDIWETLRAMLAQEGLVPRRIESIDDIARLPRQEAPAVIVVDEVPGTDESIDECAAIRRRPGLNVVPIIFLADDIERLAIGNDDRYSNAGLTTVLSKPVDAAAFKNHVRSLGDTGRTLTNMRALQVPGMTIFECMPDAFFTVSGSGLVEEHLGGGAGDEFLHAATLEGKRLGDVWPESTAAVVLQGIRRALKSRDSASVEVKLESSGDGGEKIYEARILVRGRDRVLLILRNLSDQASAALSAGTERQATGRAGSTSKEAFIERLEAVLADARLRERGAAVFCIDIDHFTRINETLGRPVGDGVLEVVAQRIERCRRGSDELARVPEGDVAGVTRISGDEFLLVLTDIESREDVDSVATRVRNAFQEPVSVSGHRLNVMPSIGIAMYPLDGEDAETLLKNSRIALDEAKITGAKGREFYTNTMKYRTVKRLDVKDELRWAIENDQLAIRFLPRIDLGTGRVAGLEALLRWIHPLRGSVPLSEVIPLAETTGLILPIGEWVVENTCRLAAEWLEAGLDVPSVSVNLSRQEFTRDDLVDIVSSGLEAASIESSMLELEITEHLLLGNRRAEAIVNELNDLGVGVVIDDFGRGHSSIAHLTKLPIKAIKIDRLFIEGAVQPGEKQSVCSAIIAMSRELGITVIAEGVEDAMQLQFLRERGCDSVQGFLYTQPLPASEVPDFLALSHDVGSDTDIVDIDTVRKKIAAKKAG